MQSKEKDNLIIARLFPEEDVYEKLRELCHQYGIKAAVVLSGIGQLKDIELGFFKEKGDYAPQALEGNYELLSLGGTMLAQDEKTTFHLHGVFGDLEKKALGGHLIRAKVSVTLEIALLKTDPLFRRQLEAETGLEGMFLD
jgi:predicted DNA-binding protein with PD1-like motif